MVSLGVSSRNRVMKGCGGASRQETAWAPSGLAGVARVRFVGAEMGQMSPEDGVGQIPVISRGLQGVWLLL